MQDTHETVAGGGFSFGNSLEVQDLSSVHMISALLLAGLYPNVARLDPPKASAVVFCLSLSLSVSLST